ncbi:sulfur carrier protein ThiS [Glutamicibacter creatinolyticus]|uniref:sulfur carrier protein ThiS n=1 Tax=Glutamicibacter creatinolyticus TaxID=162496 RepID=UPI0037BFCEFB
MPEITEIEVQLNGQRLKLPDGATVRDIVAGHTKKLINEQGLAVDGSRLGIALAIDGDVIPRSAWASRTVAPGARIDLVTAAQGG